MKKYLKHLVPKSFRLWLHYQGFKLRALKYRGQNVRCNVCEKSFSGFLAKANREGAICPYCNSLERQRFMVFHLEDQVLPKGNLNEVLYFSPLPTLQKRIQSMVGIGHLRAGDIDPAAADEIVDITSINYPDGFFNLVICSHVLAHIPNEKLALNELFRVTKKGGFVYVFTNYEAGQMKSIELKESSQQTAFNIESDTLRIHGIDLKERLEESGFQVDIVVPNQVVSKDEMKVLGMRDDDVLFLCSIV